MYVICAVVIFVALFFLVLSMKRREGYKDPIYPSKEKLLADNYPRSNGSIYVGEETCSEKEMHPLELVLPKSSVARRSPLAPGGPLSGIENYSNTLSKGPLQIPSRDIGPEGYGRGAYPNSCNVGRPGLPPIRKPELETIGIHDKERKHTLIHPTKPRPILRLFESPNRENGKPVLSETPVINTSLKDENPGSWNLFSGYPQYHTAY